MSNPTRLPKSVRFRLPKGVVEHLKRSKAADDAGQTSSEAGASWLSGLFERLSVSGGLVMLIACACLATMFVLEFGVR